MLLSGCVARNVSDEPGNLGIIADLSDIEVFGVLILVGRGGRAAQELAKQMVGIAAAYGGTMYDRGEN